MGFKKVAYKAWKQPKFDSEEAETRFNEHIQTRPLSAEKGFVLQDAETMGQPPFIAEVIQQHNWRLFGAHPEDPIVPLVREFYANLLNPEEETVFVRGFQVPFSVQVINSLFEIGDPVDEHSEFIEDITEDELITVLEAIAVAGTEWQISSQGAYTCLRSALTSPAKIWYHFLKSRLLPTTHGKTVSKDRALLLYSILNGKSIDVGRIIYNEICACAARKTGALFFPSLITRLCRNVHVPFTDDEEKLHNTGAIDAAAVARICQEGPAPRARRAPRADAAATASTQQPSSSRSAAASSSSNAAILQQLQLLEQRMSQQEIQQYDMMTMLQQSHQQQQQYWAYAKERDTALKKSLQKNFSKPTFPFPDFPEEILQDLAAEDMEESNEGEESNGESGSF